MALEDQVASHYGSGGIAARVIAAFREAQGADAAPTAEALAPFDQFHGRGPASASSTSARVSAARRGGSPPNSLAMSPAST